MGLESPRSCYNRPRGGAAGIRTPDLRRARAALSRLSYGPSAPVPSCRPPAAGGRAWTRTRDLGLIRAALSPPELRARRQPPRHAPLRPQRPVSPGSPRVNTRPMPKTERADPTPTSKSRCQGGSAQPNSHPFRQPARSAAGLPGIAGAPARPYHRLATGGPRGSVPTDAGSPPGGLTGSGLADDAARALATP